MSYAPGTPGQVLLNGVVYQTIQDAVDAASLGSTVHLTAGVYALAGNYIPVNYPTRRVGLQLRPGVTLRGAGADVTTIDAGGPAFAAVVDANNAVIEGVTVINSGFLSWRYGILLDSAGSTVRNCIVKGAATGLRVSQV